MTEMPEPTWLSACGSSACFEILHQPDGTVLIRDSGDKTVFIAGSAAAWRDLVDAIRDGRIA